MIGRRGERGSGISMLAAKHDDDDDEMIYCRSPRGVVANELNYDKGIKPFIPHPNYGLYSTITVLL